MKILIIGATPLGAYLAAHFTFLQQDYHWYTSPQVAASVLDAGGILALGARGRRWARGVRMVTSAGEAYSEQYDVVFMAIQGYAVTDALYEMMQHAPSLRGSQTAFVAMQRGIGPHERIASVFGEKHTIRAALTTWIEHPISGGQPAPHIFVRMPSGGVAVAEGHPLSAEIAALLYAAYLPVLLGDSREIGWSALLWQLQANTIPALMDLDADDVYHSPSLAAIEHAMLLEALGVIQALGVRLIDLPGAPVRRLATQLQLYPPALFAERGVRNPAPPSLRVELEQGIDRSEAAYLNGAIAVNARDLELNAPINYVLALTLDDIANGRALWAMFRGNPRMLEAIINVATDR